MQQMATTQQDTMLMKALALVEEFRKVDATIAAQTASTFIFVALRSGDVTVGDVEKHLAMSLSAASRNVTLLSDIPSKYRQGASLGLVEYRDDPNDRRRKPLFLTKKGAKLASEIISIMAR